MANNADLINISDADTCQPDDIATHIINLCRRTIDLMTNNKLNKKRTEIFNEYLNDAFDILTDDNITNKQLDIILENSKNSKKNNDQIRDVDMDMAQYLHESKNENDIYHVNDIQDKLDDINDDSLIIYVKKAKLYKVYSANHMDDFENDSGTHYRKPEYGPAYEVVRDKHTQKLIFVMSGEMSDTNINQIRDSLIKFISSKSDKSGQKAHDLKVYNSNHTTEFMISNYSFENISAKQLFLEDFIRFMQSAGKDEIASKILITPPPCELVGARFYKLPTDKLILDGNKMKPITDNILNHMITTSTSPVVMQQNINIVVNNTINNTINGNVQINSTKIKKSNEAKKTLKSFYKYIYDTKPAWYLSGKSVPVKIIEQAYRDYFDDNTTGWTSISRQLNGSLFTKTERSNNIVKKKLIQYEKLKDLY